MLPPSDFESDWIISILLPASQVPGSREQPEPVHRARAVSPSSAFPSQGLGPFLHSASLSLSPRAPRSTSCTIKPCPCSSQHHPWNGSTGLFLIFASSESQLHFSVKTVAMSKYAKYFRRGKPKIQTLNSKIHSRNVRHTNKPRIQESTRASWFSWREMKHLSCHTYTPN